MYNYVNYTLTKKTMEPQEQEIINTPQDYQEPMSGVVLHEENPHSMEWVWWLLGIFIVLGLGWYFFGKKGQDTSIIDGLSNKPASEVVNTVGDLADVSESSIELSSGFPLTATLKLQGDLQDGCTYLNDTVQQRQGTRFKINLTTRTEGDSCTQALVPYERNVNLDVKDLPAGTYFVDVNGETLSFEIPQQNSLEYTEESTK